MNVWTLLSGTVCSIATLILNNEEDCLTPPAYKVVDNQVHINAVIHETNSHLPIAVQIMNNAVDQTLNVELKRILFESVINKELDFLSLNVSESDLTTVSPDIVTEVAEPTPVTDATAQDESLLDLEDMRNMYESRLKKVMFSELIDLESQLPLGENVLFNGEDAPQVNLREIDALPGSKLDSEYWQPDVNKLLDSIKVTEMLQQISPELLTLAELRDFLISEAIHRKLRYTSGLSDSVMRFLKKVTNKSTGSQVLAVLKQIVEAKDVSDQRTIEFIEKVTHLLESPTSKLSKILEKSSPLSYRV